jgi:enterochelin esterase family protein
MEPKPLLMSRDTNGVWTVTTSAAQPEIYTYHFNVDGESVLDPSNRWHKPSLLHQDNLFEVPGEQAQLWDRTTAPHGSVTHHYFQSAAIAVPSEYYVYTPPGYDAESRAKYPVLYLLHGYSDGANAWLEIGRVNFILDNLIAQRRAKPMIVVMPLGYGAPEVLTNQASFFNSHVAIRLYSAFRDSLFNEVMPRVARAYRVLTGPSSTAIAGLSMGGGESLVIGVGHPEKFGYVGSFSGAVVGKNPEDSDFMWKAPRKLLWIACGDSDLLVGDSNKSMRLWLEEHGVQATFSTTTVGHQWPVCRDNLASFVPLIFS